MAQPSTELSKLRESISLALDAIAVMKARCDEVRSCARSRGVDVVAFLVPAVYVVGADGKVVEPPTPIGDLQTPEEAFAGLEAAEKLATIATNDLDALTWMRNR